MFETRIPQPTDEDLLSLLATAGMGWKLHRVSGHRPGSREIPHAWKWNRDRVRIMVYLGGEGEGACVEFDPLNHAETTLELIKRLKGRDIDVTGWDVNTKEGRRSTCEAAAEKIKATPPPIQGTIYREASPIAALATITAHTLSEGMAFPPPGLIAKAGNESLPHQAAAGLERGSQPHEHI